MATLAPTATILPSRMSTVPFSIVGPLTGYTVPPVMAMVCAAATEADADSSDGGEQGTCAHHLTPPRLTGTKPSSKSVRHCCDGSSRSNIIAPSIHTFSARE